MRSLEPAYAWSMSTTFHTQRVLTARLSKCRCISFTNMPWIFLLLFLSSRMYRKLWKYQRANVWTGSSMSRPCCNSKYQPAIWYNGRWRLYQQGHTSVLVSSLQGARICCFKLIQQMVFQWCCKAKHYLSQQFQKQLKIHRFSFLLWRLTCRIRVQRRVRQFHAFVIPTFSHHYCVLTSDLFGFFLYSSPRSRARFGVVASRQYDKDHDRIQQSSGTWHLRQV